MNKNQRKKLADILEVIEGQIVELEEMAEEEQEKADNIPDNLNNSDRAIMLMESADNLNEAVADLQNWVDEVRENFELY